MTNAGVVLDEWRAEVDSESRNSSGPAQLILSMPLHYSPTSELGSVLPVESIRRNVDWGLLLPYNYHVITKENITLANAPLYDPASDVNTDYGVREWLAKGFPANKLIFGITYYAFVWKLVNPADNYIGAPSLGIIDAVGYNELKLINQTYGVKTIFNATYVVNQCVIQSNWICFDDVDAVRIKIAYAKEKKLLGYFVHPINYDENWVLSRAAGMIRFRKGGLSGPVANPSAAEHLGSNVPHLRVFSFSSIKAATNDFSSENELGKGGFGPVYEGKLPRGQHIAVKRLSKTSTQGHTEFTNEVTLTARLQHRNLVRVLGYCIEREEKMLIYEYMPNRSLDFHLYDPNKRNILDWGKLVHIIEGVIQGLLYLQEYSNFTIIHRDLKASNILLDKDMNPKISDFGMAKLFGKDEHEANTDRIVGTYGYVPPEYVRKGIYSMKYDVYSFGVLLLQIISGKRNGFHYGANENLSLLEYKGNIELLQAYELWKEGGGNQFIDPSLNDSSSPCKL
ncbi:hypothetical protein CJ030_MR5G004823 [Morella rubra]|uniref:Uncharacterized protein n=1 Tax=Morella rubra TaxID=262757 RepID=A0A6A1VJ55_9ROSI|nr:hypothetical protein CJ030_MR5G004823 [Morella rubra]